MAKYNKKRNNSRLKRYKIVYCESCNYRFRYYHRNNNVCPRCGVSHQETTQEDGRRIRELGEPIQKQNLLEEVEQVNNEAEVAIEENLPPQIMPEYFNARGIEYSRDTFRWGSFGINGDEEITSVLLKDISDSHLVHIIGYLIIRRRNDNLIIMLEEAKYRSENKIFVSDYTNN